jgi:NAD(P)-dependent dehydrogenase (short-subunit alcohol dehydrogenase family)
MKINGKVALVTGAASGIGEAVAVELARRGVKALAAVDRSPKTAQVAQAINEAAGRPVAEPYVGDAANCEFRAQVYEEMVGKHGVVNICVPAAGITRDALSVKVDRETGRAVVYPLKQFREVTEVNLIAPVFWALEMVAHIAEERKRRGLGRWEAAEKLWGTVVFIGSVSSQGNKGQIAYAASKAGLEGAAATLTKEAIYHGVKCCVIHPGFTDTPMVRAMGEEYIAKNILPATQLRRLIRPDEIADAICFLIANSAVSGELWADAGWHPSA